MKRKKASKQAAEGCGQCFSLKEQLECATRQRDSALRQINDVANIKKSVSLLNEHSLALRKAIDEVETAVKIVRHLLGIATPLPSYLYRGQKP